MLNYPAAYQSTKGSALDVDKAFYQRVASQHDTRTLVESIVVPIRSGQAWTVPAGPRDGALSSCIGTDFPFCSEWPHG